MEHETALQELMLLSEVESLSVMEFLSMKFSRHLDAATGATLTTEQRAQVLKAFRDTFSDTPQEKW